MRYPAFVAEMGLPANRPKIWAGVVSGYWIAVVFALFAVGAATLGMSPYGVEFGAMVGIKLVLNTVVLIALRRRWPVVLELMALNMTGDALLMTAAVYYTGGPASPLGVIYVIEVTVTALLSNVGVTLLVAGGILACFATMCGLLVAGVLPPTLPPGAGHFGAVEAAVFVAFAAFALGVPTLYTLRILAQLREKEGTLETRTADLIEAGRQRSVFLASVTHELRTPIHGVQGLADLIASGVYGPVTPKQKDACNSIKRSAQGLLQLIDDLLALVRADVGRLEVQRGAVDVAELVDQVVASVQWMLGTKRLRVSTEVSTDGGEVVSDRRLLGHILVNLVANAAKFTPEGGRVTVRAEVAAGRLRLSVSDTGIGIPDDKREAVFEAFRQLDPSDERTYGGVGLGLALVRRLAELLGGTITLDSTVGHGSTFRVNLPARLAAPDRPEMPGTTASGPSRPAAEAPN